MQEDRPDLAKLVHERYGRDWKCACTFDARSRRSANSCAREILIAQGAQLTVALRDYTRTNEQLANRVGTHPSNISRLTGNQSELGLGLESVFAVVERLQQILVEVKEEYLLRSIPSGRLVLKTLDNCSSSGVTDEVNIESSNVVFDNLRAILLDRPVTDQKALPAGVEAVLTQLGDPRCGMFLFQVSRPNITGGMGPIEDDTKIHFLRRVIHELKHIEERFQHELRRLLGARPSAKARKDVTTRLS